MPEKAREQVRLVRLAPEADAREALEAACEREGPFDLCIVGSRGMGALKRAAAAVTGHGSVSNHLLAHAPCPVLVVSRATLLAWIEDAVPPTVPALATAPPPTPAKEQMPREPAVTTEIKAAMQPEA